MKSETVSISMREVAAHEPSLLLPPDREFEDSYWERVKRGRVLAKDISVAFVAICRNAMPWLEMTLARIDATATQFRWAKTFIYENDSEDGSKDCLAGWSREKPHERQYVSVDNGRPHLNFSKSSDRTVALAEYRNKCRLWVDSLDDKPDLTIVFDTDPWGGFSVDGILHTLALLAEPEHEKTAAMASYSFCRWGPPVWPQPVWCQYDAWAARWTWWRERQDMTWFHLWLPPVGSDPIKFNSAFGQLGVYRTEPYTKGEYHGGDCEHVSFHKSLGGGLYLNPSQRVVSFWIPNENFPVEGDRMHGDVH